MVLGTRSYWRVFPVLRPPLWGTASDAKVEPKFIPKVSLEQPRPILPPDQPSSPPPPADWMQADFDDFGWWRDPGPFFGGSWDLKQLFTPPHASIDGESQTIALARLCVRGKFVVTNTATVKALTLDVEFRGGLVVYLNGVEVARRFLPAGPLGPDQLADDYPDNAWFNEQGTPLRPGTLYDARKKSGKHFLDVEPRIRRLEAAALPTSLLRPGTNVLAIEVRRAALNRRVAEFYHRPSIDNVWSTVGLHKVELRATGDSVRPNVSRPKGVQVWNSTVLEAVYDTDYGDPTDRLRPVRIVAARNGSFSGQVVIGSDTEIEGLQAEIGPLQLEGGVKATLPPALIRYPQHGRYEPFSKPAMDGIQEGSLRTFDALMSSPPERVAAREKDIKKGSERVSVSVGAVQPIWVTVRVPPDARTGVYRGEMTLRWATQKSSGPAAPGLTPPLAVPVEVEVCGFRLPEPCDFSTWVDFVQSPDALAIQYSVPLWSDKHWDLIANSLRLLAQVGNKTLYVPLIAKTHYGNDETMVRWVRGAGGEWTGHDFSIMERYLDLASKSGLKPKAVVLYVWDYRTGHLAHDTRRAFGETRWGHLGVSKDEPGFHPVEVSVKDPATGRITLAEGPAYNDPGAERFWAPVAEGIRNRLKQRGLEKTMMVGIVGDSLPQPEVVELWKKVLPGTRWMARTHGGARRLHGEPMGYLAKVILRWAVDPAVARYYGWQRRPDFPIEAYFPRLQNTGVPQTFNRLTFEWNLQSGHAGVGQLAADTFGRVTSRFSAWGTIGLRAPWLAAGPDAAISTVRFELAREGIQECEARIFIERILTDPERRAKLSDEHSQRLQDMLDNRTRELAWACEYDNVFGPPHSFLVSATGGVLGSDWYAGGDRWQQSSRRLFTAASELQSLFDAR